jgi:RHS repeat-associated protein
VFDGAGVQTHRYLYGAGVDQILADERGGSVVWALADNLGTVRDLVDGNGVVLNHVTYDSYGRVISQTNPAVEFRYGYTGREQDNETGLDYYRARYYDASVGRFISEDPLGFNAGDGNLTRYVGNSPLNGTDSSGLQSATSDPFLEGLIFVGTGLLIGGKYLGDRFGDFADGGKVSNGTIPPRRQGTTTSRDPFQHYYKAGSEDVPDLTGKPRIQAEQELADGGFEKGKTTAGGYQRWRHPDGSEIGSIPLF